MSDASAASPSDRRASRQHRVSRSNLGATQDQAALAASALRLLGNMLWYHKLCDTVFFVATLSLWVELNNSIKYVVFEKCHDEMAGSSGEMLGGEKGHHVNHWVQRHHSKSLYVGGYFTY